MSKDESEFEKQFNEILGVALEHAKATPFTNPAGIDLFSTELDKEEAELLLMAVLAEEKQGDLDIPLKEMGWQIAAVEKRISVLKLPIKFTNLAYLSFGSFTKTVGGCMVILIDALNKYEGQTVNVKMLCEMYPNGFYTESSLGKYIDQYLKPQTSKWSEVYGVRQ
jgi:hypothetical protein